MSTAITSDAELRVKLREILESWPLYRQFQYAGSAWTQLPKEIRLFCGSSVCGKEQQWQLGGFARSTTNHKQDFSDITYVCRNCGIRTTRYFLFWGGEKADGGLVFKAGQYPPLVKEPPAELAAKLDKADLELYRKALTSRNNSYGIGAVAYLRRVIENKMNDLLDLLHQAAKEEPGAQAELQKIEEVKKSWRFDDKIGYAANALPKHLKPGGTNPLDRLHDLASEGMHHKSDDECLDIFDRCRGAFEYVFRQLVVEIEDARAYMADLTSKLSR